jgi:hypothetical protein
VPLPIGFVCHPNQRRPEAAILEIKFHSRPRPAALFRRQKLVFGTGHVYSLNPDHPVFSLRHLGLEIT